MDRKTILEIAERLDQLSDAITKGKESILKEFTMTIPARPTRDADLVLSSASRLLKQQLNIETSEKESILGSSPDDFKGTALNKIKFLENKGGKVMRMAQVIRMPDGSECAVDSFARCNWITKPNGTFSK